MIWFQDDIMSRIFYFPLSYVKLAETAYLIENISIKT